MSDIDEKRDFVRNLYRAKTWKNRVDNMADGQVIAIYIAKQQYFDNHKVAKAITAKRNLDKDNPPF
jgi:hypothetical protein